MFICDSCYELAVKHKIESHDIRECAVCKSINTGKHFHMAFYTFVWENYILSKKKNNKKV